jgi:UDP-N-acetylmuramoylalanine--D-glutamate ligase
VVVTSLGEDHVDWHGSLSQYHSDKLQLTRAEGFHHTVVPDDDAILQNREQLGGELVVVGDLDAELATLLGLIGDHNARNVALALRTVALALHRPISEVRDAAIREAHVFSPLPGRLTLAHRATIGGHRVDFVDDGLATNPLPVVAATRSFAGQDVALIVGGFDRGVDYAPLLNGLHDESDRITIWAVGPAGQRIASLAATTHASLKIETVDDLPSAVHHAVHALPEGGVVLFSPGAPSFDAYKNWEERSAHFTTLAATY